MKSLFHLFQLLSFTLALDDFPPAIHIPEVIHTGTEVEGYVDVEVHNFDTTYCNAFRVYLATRPGEQRNPAFYHEDCMSSSVQTFPPSPIYLSL
ncbi:uncharacterized protein EI97DRAFT_434221 [Westerdykella ornata]|uniref:Uncharacterized protein n=1 Tax=Westerdykella ornata TaxID=318751 RepID=A0A6A6JKG1_WESOR|nr:uncharacterized protein EI97DRAFT_434221 [Westerdykella ornata]KAF2275369.1 hypothetical protein EI97DRAFT_434221 [Westerdykella ornata]